MRTPRRSARVPHVMSHTYDEPCGFLGAYTPMLCPIMIHGVPSGFTAIQERKFTGVHNRKLGILTLCMPTSKFCFLHSSHDLARRWSIPPPTRHGPHPARRLCSPVLIGAGKTVLRPIYAFRHAARARLCHAAAVHPAGRFVYCTEYFYVYSACPVGTSQRSTYCTP